MLAFALLFASFYSLYELRASRDQGGQEVAGNLSILFMSYKIIAPTAPVEEATAIPSFYSLYELPGP